MKVSVIAPGYYGLVMGACLADSGYDVLDVDINQAEIDVLLAGGVPIHEAGLDELITCKREKG